MRGMLEKDPIGVVATFEVLLEEIEAEIMAVSEAGARALANLSFSAAQEAIRTAEQMTDLRARVAALRQEWITLAHAGRTPVAPAGEPVADPAQRRLQKPGHGKRRSYGYLRPGLKTPEEEYRIPILQVLAERNGSARVGEVLKGVYERMKHRLDDVDRQRLPSSPNTRRWENTAQWARHRTVQEGLLASDSPHGVWEITERGRRVLSQVQPR